MAYIPDTAYNPGFPVEWEGLGFESAEACTPKWYGVSSGNGNDGISHARPDYYVRTADPYRLASLAMLNCFRPMGWRWAAEAMEVDGEADYTISAVIYNPPRDEKEPKSINCEACGGTGEVDEEECEDCGGTGEIEPDEDSDSDWCSVNGAWLIVEVFPVEDMDSERSSAPQYDSLNEAFSAELLACMPTED